MVFLKDEIDDFVTGLDDMGQLPEAEARVFFERLLEKKNMYLW